MICLSLKVASCRSVCLVDESMLIVINDLEGSMNECIFIDEYKVYLNSI